MSCDRKYKGQGPSKSGARPKKRKPPYKYKTTGSKVARRLDLPVIDLVDQPSTSSASSSVVDLDLVPEDNISQNLQLKSRSAHKLCFYDIPYPESEEDWTDIDSDEEDNCDELVNSASTRLIDLNILQAHVSESVSCRHCHADVNLVEVKRAGLGSIFRPVYIHVMPLREFRFSRNYVNGFVHVMHYVNSIFHVMVSDGLAAAV